MMGAAIMRARMPPGFRERSERPVRAVDEDSANSGTSWANCSAACLALHHGLAHRRNLLGGCRLSGGVGVPDESPPASPTPRASTRGTLVRNTCQERRARRVRRDSLGRTERRVRRVRRAISNDHPHGHTNSDLPLLPDPAPWKRGHEELEDHGGTPVVISIAWAGLPARRLASLQAIRSPRTFLADIRRQCLVIPLNSVFQVAESIGRRLEARRLAARIRWMRTRRE